ncbi:MAG: SRPBCC domain-containing protein [Weeksellaceae bacterium]|nr:SRPBCC domain-containing protein [Bacteroidota bacterium]MCG2780889.1 SRPBCC domain-containing protein [Weeksellaceae bacterium]
MNSNSDREIFSSRILHSPIEHVYQAFADPLHLKNWWGPEGFTNTIHEFDLRPGGRWILTMHGPEQGHYENSSVFKTVQPPHSVTWKRISKPLFDMEIGFEKISESETKIFFSMIFATREECDKIRRFAALKNEENFDRLERELLTFPE